MNRRKKSFSGVSSYVDRHGKARNRLRNKKLGIDCQLPGVYGSPEFIAAYQAAIQGAKQPQSTAAHGTLAWLIEKKKSSLSYRNLSPSRKKTLGRLLDWVNDAAGKYPFASLRVEHIEALMAKKAGPSAANDVKKVVTAL